MNALRKLPELVTESTMIPSGDAGIELYMRNKRPAGMTKFPRRQDSAVRTRRNLSFRNRVRPSDRRRLDDGSDRGARLRRLSRRYQRLWPLAAAPGNERAAAGRQVGRLEGRCR